MKVFSSVHEFHYSWDEVSAGLWKKYCPWNKESEHVIAVDTLSRRLDKDTGILRTERLITCKQSAPGWLQPFLKGTDVSHVYEISYVAPAQPSSQNANAHIFGNPTTQNVPIRADAQTTRDLRSHSVGVEPVSKAFLMPKQRLAPRLPSITMLSFNISWNDLLSVEETVTYTPSPSSFNARPDRTRFEQSAKITALCGGWQKVREKIETFTVERFGQNAERGKKGFEGVLERIRMEGISHL